MREFWIERQRAREKRIGQRKESREEEEREKKEKEIKEGKLTVLQLDDALKKQTSAQKNYLNHLSDYWQYYYMIQKYTLYDFKAQVELDEVFDVQLNEMQNL